MSDMTPREVEMVEDTDVAEYIRRKNEARNKRAKEEGWTFWTTTPESRASEYDNVYEYEREMAVEAYSNAYKAENGFRPRNTQGCTLAEVEAMIDSL